MSAYYPQLPHGAGLIALSEAYFETFRNDCMKRYMNGRCNDAAEE